MDIIFTCPNCRQELESDARGVGTEIQCPECGFSLTIPEASPQNIKVTPAITQPAAVAEKKEHRLVLPATDKKVKVEIGRSKPTLEITAKGADKVPKIKTFLHSDYSAKGAGAFDQVVSDFLHTTGFGNIHAVLPVHCSHLDPVSKQVLGDFGVVIYHGG
jgi:DNA-directed RNA polymerase subunit RPC12/RpoP